MTIRPMIETDIAALNQPLKPYANCVNDDDLVLYQSKKLQE